ncbi:MAG: Uma2 family endonuclease [Bryobacteraceae bacterium]
MAAASRRAGTLTRRTERLSYVNIPKKNHTRMQKRLGDLLSGAGGQQWVTLIELPFVPAPSRDASLMTADVAVVGVKRWSTDEDWLTGSPELVIEVLASENTASEMLDRERTCFRGGCREFWEVDPDRRLLRVTHKDGKSATYGDGDRVPVALFGSVTISVEEIFSS